MTADLARVPAASNRTTSSVLVVECDKTWQPRPLPPRPLPPRPRPAPPPPAAGSGDPLEELFGGAVELIPLTPRACLCVGDAFDQHQPANPLASALLGFLQLPIVQVLGTACITGYDGTQLSGLTQVQQRGFSRTLTTLLAMPDYLALHAQACRISVSWARPQ